MLNKAWQWLDGKKSAFGLAGLFLYGGLLAIGYDLPWLKDASQWVLAGGVVHKLEKVKM